MRSLHKALFLVPLFTAFTVAPAAAQAWKWDWGVNVGYSFFTSSLGQDETGIADGAGSSVKFGSGGLVGTQLGVWFNPKLGLRLNGRYADRPVEAEDFANDVIEHVNLWAATADLMFRFKAPAPEFTHMEMLPYLALGAGARWHNGAGDGWECNEPDSTYNCSPFVTGSRGFALGEENEVAFLVGLGADWRLSRSLALRTELSDVLFKPQFHQTAGPPFPTGRTWVVPDGEVVAKMTHELGLQVGLQFLFGLEAVPVVAVAPPPAPPAPPVVETPTVRRESVSVCVIDPTATGGIRMQDAVVVEGRDTVIVVNGSDRPFRESVGNVMVATNADWYVQGRPLTMTIGTGKAEFATYGTPRMVMGSDLAYLGTVNGYPVYADRDDVKDVIDELNDLRAAQAGKDLGEILNQQKDLRTAMENVKVFYVPTAASGCVFQAVQRQEEVRKGK